jgi:hypothetical protein
MALIRKLIIRLWHSPTFTSWAGKGAQSVRLLLVLPLILRNFDEVQIAAWFLFATLTFFTQLIFEQTSQIFSRMIALAVGGAKDLRPIKPGEAPRGNDIPNWTTIQKLYETIGGLNLAVSSLGIFVTLGLGAVSFRKILEGYDKSHEIWIAFGIFLLGDFLAQVFRKYAISLRGLNQVALTNRWGALFSILSSLAGAASLLAGVSIIGLSVIVQSFNLLSIFRLRFFLFKWVEPRFRAFRPYALHKDILLFLFTPLWRALVQSYAMKGGLKIGIIIYTQFATAADLASMLLLIRLLDTVKTFAVAPIGSHVPKFSRLLAEGKIGQLTKSVLRAMKQAQWVLVLGFFGIAFIAPLCLSFIQSNTRLPDPRVIGFLLISFHLMSIITYSLLLTVLGNNYILIKQMLAACIITLVSAPFLISHYGPYGFIFGSFWPFVMLLNTQSLKYCGNQMKVSIGFLFKQVFALPILISVLLTAILLVL